MSTLGTIWRTAVAVSVAVVVVASSSSVGSTVVSAATTADTSSNVWFLRRVNRAMLPPA